MKSFSLAVASIPFGVLDIIVSSSTAFEAVVSFPALIPTAPVLGDDGEIETEKGAGGRRIMAFLLCSPITMPVGLVAACFTALGSIGNVLLNICSSFTSTCIVSFRARMNWRACILLEDDINDADVRKEAQRLVELVGHYNSGYKSYCGSSADKKYSIKIYGDSDDGTQRGKIVYKIGQRITELNYGRVFSDDTESVKRIANNQETKEDKEIFRVLKKQVIKPMMVL